MDVQLSGMVALVTGGGSGIGLAVAKALASQGAMVAINDVDARACENAVSSIRQSGGDATAVVADISDEPHVERMISQIHAEYGKLDILINNAGVWWPARDARVSKLDLATWNDLLRINLTGTFLCCRYAIPLIELSESGSIVNIASAAALTGWPDMDAYTASKGGVLSLTRALAAEYGPNIRVNAICPGAIATPLTESAQAQAGFPRNSLRRVGRAEEVAAAVLFFASPASSYITGEYLTVDGGRRSQL